MAQDKTPASFAALSEDQRVQAMARLTVLRPHLDDGVPITRTAAAAGVPLRTTQRWLARYRPDGLAGLTRSPPRGGGRPRLPADLVAVIEGMGLKRPRSSAAAIHRRIMAIAKAQGWRTPSYGTICAILTRLDPAMLTLALEGPAAFRDRYELICRHRASAPNALWQADHTLLDILVLDAGGQPVRPPHAPHRGPRRGRPAGPPLAHDCDRRSFARDRRLLGVPGFALGAQYEPRAAPRDLAQGGPGLADLRDSGRALRRSRQRLHQPAPRPSGCEPARPGRVFRRRATAGPGQGRAAVRDPQHRTPARAARPPRRGQAC